jgi:hypothetical protein
MKRGAIIAEIAAWTLFFPIAIVLIVRRQLGYGYETTEGRVDALLQWYPAPWRQRHGDRFSELLRDTIADGRGDLRMRVDVAREGVAERRRAFRWEGVWSWLLLTVGWIMVLPQGIVAPILGLFDGFPPTWFLALHVDGAERWLVAGGMVAIGLLLIDRGLMVAARDHAAREARYGSSAG